MVATAPVARPDVLLDKLAPRLRVLVNIYLALMRQNRLLVSKTTTEITLALAANVVRTVVILDKLVPLLATPVRT